MEKKSKKITVAIFLVVLTTLAAVFVVINLLMRIRASSQNYLSEKEELAVLKHKEKELEGESLAEVLKYRRTLEKLFTDPERPISEIIFLEERADRNGLDYQVHVGEKKIDQGSPYLEFEIDLSGDLFSILNFFDGLETENNVLFVDRVEFDFAQNQISDGEKDFEEVSLSAVLGVYYLSDN